MSSCLPRRSSGEGGSEVEGTGDTPASRGTQPSSIGRIPTRRGIEWLKIPFSIRVRRSFCLFILDASPREAEPFTRITWRCRAVRSLPLALSSVPLIPSRQCASFIEKSELTRAAACPGVLFQCILITFSTRRPLLPTPRSDHVLNKPGLGICSPLDDNNPGPAHRVYPPAVVIG